MVSPVLRRILEEFSIPALVAIAWTTYNIHSSSQEWSLKGIVNILGPSFFLVTWATGQFFRVKKQVAMESGLKTIESNIIKLIDDLDLRTRNVIGHVNGGPSFCYLSCGHIDEESKALNLTVHHDSEFQLYDIRIRIVDLLVMYEEVEKSSGNLRKADTYYSLDSLLPGYAAPLYEKGQSGERASFNLGRGDKAAFNIFFAARNGAYTQHFRFARVGNGWRKATRVEREREVLFEKIDDGFPIEVDGGVDWQLSSSHKTPGDVLFIA